MQENKHSIILYTNTCVVVIVISIAALW